jgi:uncharacterized protein
MKKFSLNDFYWLNEPEKYSIDKENNRVVIYTSPRTDLWQRTYYGFRHDNAPAYLIKKKGNFTFCAKAFYEANNLYDQCGLLLYHNSDNWVKVSVEYENDMISRLGSVVTNKGYSDWATSDIDSSVNEIWYRFNRRGKDFYIEYSKDGKEYVQMRMFHMHINIDIAGVGVYACSPMDSDFKAIFSEISLGDCIWQAHE